MRRWRCRREHREGAVLAGKGPGLPRAKATACSHPISEPNWGPEVQGCGREGTVAGAGALLILSAVFLWGEVWEALMPLRGVYHRAAVAAKQSLGVREGVATSHISQHLTRLSIAPAASRGVFLPSEPLQGTSIPSLCASISAPPSNVWGRSYFCITGKF